MKVTVFGAGYVGLVQAAALADFGHDVVCVDTDAAKVAGLRAASIPFHEPGLADLVASNAAQGRLRFTTDATEGVGHGEIIFIAVGTPPDATGAADLSFVLAVAQTIATEMAAPKVVVVKSTVPVGTADRIEAALIAKRPPASQHHAVSVVSNPEFLKEGSAVVDCMRPDRIIIGSDDLAAIEVLRELYAPFNRNHEKIIVMDRRSAELAKYAANCMLAAKISFMNEMAVIADQMGADIEQIRRGIGADPRIGYHFIYAGIGYGGSCFPKDVRALIHTAEDAGIEPLMLQAIEARNTRQKTVLFDKIERHYGGALKGKTFALWGVAFKPNTDDMRDAPSRVVLEALWAAGCTVQVYDPAAMAGCAAIYGERPDLVLVSSRDAALAGADGLIIATEWKEFQAPDFELIRETLRDAVIFDGRNILSPDLTQRYGIKYYGIGRQQR